ncbi:hypothetical protein D3C80_1493710 [compost metagenome]
MLFGAVDRSGKLGYSSLIDFFNLVPDHNQCLCVALMQDTDLFFTAVVLCSLGREFTVLAFQFGSG